MTDSNLAQLVKRVRTEGRLAEAGFQVYHWAGDRADLNDWGNGDHNHQCYTRAVHNLENLDESYGSHINNAVNTIVGGAVNGDNVDFNVVAHGPMYGLDYVPSRVKRDGLLGLLGFKRNAGGEMVRDPTRKRYLNTLIQTGVTEDAYFVHFVLKARVRDGGGRSGSHPTLSIIAGKELAEQIVAYLKENPNDYENMIRQMLPKEEFPNVNKGILDKMQPADSIVFLDADNVLQIGELTSYNGNLKPEVFERFGERIERKR